MKPCEIWFRETFSYLQLDEQWTILPDTAKFLFDLLTELRPSYVLEFGSGISTLVMAKALESSGGYVYSLEHEERWLEHAQEKCRNAKITNCQIILAPIVEAKFPGVAPYRIYDFQKVPLQKFGLVFIDGPPGFLPEHPGRRGTFYACWPYLAPHATVILDDADREGEQLAIKEWLKIFRDAVSVKFLPLKRPIARIDLTE